MFVDLFTQISETCNAMHPDGKHFNICIHEHDRENWAWWLREVFRQTPTLRRGSRVVSVQLKTVIIVIFTLAGDEPACPGCDTPVTGVHAWQRLGMTSPTAVRQPSFHPCPTHTLTRTEVYRQSHAFKVTLFSCLYGIDCWATFVSLGPLCVPVDWEKWQLCDGWIITVPILSSWTSLTLCACVSLSKVVILSGTVLIPVDAGLTFNQLSCLQCCFTFSVTSHGNCGISDPSPLMKLIMYAEGTESR